MITKENINDITDAKVLDPQGDKIGTVGQVYVNEQDGTPLFATVSTGLFGNKQWVEFPWTPIQIAARQVSRVVIGS